MNYVRLIEKWAKDRGLDKADSAKQMIKLTEEFGELADGYLRGNRDKIEDSIGDMFVVMTIFCLQQGLNIETCIAAAYNEIKDRKGRMIGDVFVKEADLPQ